ncbi:MAG TPA: VWA domain-containing protein [Candidatus Caccousia avistercoris]|nr:VWA domain-containing protein [Candidatus Caccousia avistercoris]
MSEGSVLNRWRLVLGKNAEGRLPLETGAQELDQVLDFLYSREQSEDERQEQGGSEGSRLTVALWLNKVRRLFPRQAAEVLERHALNRYQLTELLTDKEVLEKLEPNQALLGTILGLKHLMSDSVLASARRIVKKVADELTKKMEQELRRSTLGKLDRNTASPVRSMRNLDVKKTIRRNLRHYDRENRRLTLEQVYFNGRVKKYNPWHVVIAVDESGSMLDSVIHSAIMAGIFARMPMLDLKLVIFDTQVVDLSGYAGDPVEVLMSVQLGGGTNIAGALGYCEGLITNPHRTMVILVSDLCEGGPPSSLYRVCASILESGAKLAALTALDSSAKPVYNRSVGQALADMGAFVGALTPEQLGDYMGRIMQ